MADLVRRTEYYYATMPDSPGQGARLASALKEAGVNLLALLAFPIGGGQSQVDLVPEDPVALRKAAEQAGIKLSDAKRAFLVQGDDRPGATTAIMEKLSGAGINVTAAAGVASGEGRYGLVIWVPQVDYERAAGLIGA
jgi:hypothetical protein